LITRKYGISLEDLEDLDQGGKVSRVIGHQIGLIAAQKFNYFSRITAVEIIF
jgi:hypothetical protein